MLEEVFPPDECPCKYRLGASNVNATVTVTDPEGVDTTFTGTINLTAIQCFTGGPNCNPNVDNFNLTFVGTGDDSGNTINFVQGRRGTISCVDDIIAIMENGTAMAAGNVLDGDYTVDFTYTIIPDTGTAEVVFTATGTDVTVFTTTYTADVSPQTFIGECGDTVGPQD
ncbi:hypothetical protein [Oceanobacillus saliphilus]|uniref:hypothetical protein n=1 Tax=Oceanobacillus saliphilus TaxID=2925834 RepID=UPI00201D963E|nr:hypothetical protein [Oceanobacillus saliphilus]